MRYPQNAVLTKITFKLFETTHLSSTQ